MRYDFRLVSAYAHIKRCLELSDRDIVSALEDRRSAKALLDQLAKVSRPGDGAPKLLLVFAKLAGPDVDWIDGGLRVEMSADFRPQEVCVTVRDSGIGIDPGDLPRIWDRLYRGDKSRSQRGIGLGLSLVKAFVEAHGGTAAVESQPGEGSAFTVSLPRKNSAA